MQKNVTVMQEIPLLYMTLQRHIVLIEVNAGKYN